MILFMPCFCHGCAFAFERAGGACLQTAGNDFVIPGIIPIVPGLGMYRGMAAIIENNYETGMNILITTGMDASAIALGMMLMTSVFRVIKISKDHKRLLQLLHKENKQ